jgi:hypothetical protein
MSTKRPGSSSAERTQRYRQRLRRKTRCLIVEIGDAEISALIERGYLAKESRDARGAATAAIESVISDLVFEVEQEKACEEPARRKR